MQQEKSHRTLLEELPNSNWELGARLIGVRDVLGASVLLRNILKSKYYWEVGIIDKYVFWGSIYIGENDDTL